MVDLRTLAIGAKLQLDTGATVELVGHTDSPRSVKVRYVDSILDPGQGDNFTHEISAEQIYGVYTDDTLMAVRSL